MKTLLAWDPPYHKKLSCVGYMFLSKVMIDSGNKYATYFSSVVLMNLCFQENIYSQCLPNFD